MKLLPCVPDPDLQGNRSREIVDRSILKQAKGAAQIGAFKGSVLLCGCEMGLVGQIEAKDMQTFSSDITHRIRRTHTNSLCGWILKQINRFSEPEEGKNVHFLKPKAEGNKHFFTF